MSPSSDYTDFRSKNSAGHGYILDFGPELNAKFQDALLHAYDGGWFGHKRSYDPIKDNSGQAFNKAFKAIATDLGMKPLNPGLITPRSIEEFINNNLRKYIAATTPYPKQ